MIVHIFLDFGTFYLSIHPCNNFVFVASRSTSRAFGVSVSADTCGWRMARLCCGRPGLLFAGYFLGGIFRNLACLESFFSLLLLLLLLLFFFFWTIWYPAVFIFKRQIKRARRSLNEKIRVCQDLWIGYNLTRSPQGALPIMAKTEGSARKGYLIRTSSTWKGRDFVSWSI